ncbi:hypothetical protein VE03_06837 [Pseudogymnoascus sp. 23342-1-I1]|nr:hypothetical protein VE03_06837 [Pseudogymnoascus sp. 23342-1-I1]
MAPIKLDDNEDGLLVVGSGELFCRKDVMTEQERYDAQLLGDLEFRLCENRYSHTGNLRAHLTGSHKAKLAEVRKGTNSAHHVRESARFFEATMRNHTLHVKAKEEGKAVSDYGDDDATNTPQKEKPRPRVAPRRPFLPVKKDACPPTNPTNACDVWNHFTDDEEEEASKVISDDEDEDDDDDE